MCLSIDVIGNRFEASVDLRAKSDAIAPIAMVVSTVVNERITK